jgi:hypothetical protein
MALTLGQVIADPVEVARALRDEAELFGIERCSGRRVFGGAAVFELAMRPLPVLARNGFPTERVRITVLASGENLAFPLGSPQRTFFHRNSCLPRTLCLEYPGDDPALRWSWDDGFEDYVTRVYRHLLWEEQWRRTGLWPVADAPHARPVPPVPLSAQLQEARRRWKRVS